MTQAPAEFVEFHGSQPALADSLGVQVGDFHATLPIVFGSTGTWTLIVPTSNLAAVTSMQPTCQNFPDVLTQMPRSSVHPFSMETTLADTDLHGRHFSSPFSLTVEDPVTGTASAVMEAYMARYAPEFCKDRKYTLQVEQGFEVGREGRVEVTVVNRTQPFEVRIAGTGVFVKDLLLELPDVNEVS
ncbi:MAG: PhzF family phenazine biosynthesis isomerase [Fuerstiella sp.]